MKMIFYGILVLVWSTNGYAQASAPITIGEAFTFESSILNEERTYSISLPNSYEGDHFYIEKQYPILILLDGERLFPLISNMVQTMSSGGVEQIPEMIVVGVHNTNRNRDFLPDFLAADTSQLADYQDESDLFLDFLEQELLPRIKASYRTLDCLVLAGHSFGGLVAVNALLQKRNFAAYLAIDPSLWWQSEGINRRYSSLYEHDSLKGQLYVSQSNNPFNPGIEGNRLGIAVQNFKKEIEKAPSAKLRTHFDFFEKEDHFSVPLISAYEGLQFLFKGYKFPLDQLKQTTIEEVKVHYEALESRLGGSLQPPGKLLNQVGLFLLNSENEIDKATELFEFNVLHYPNSAYPFRSLGMAYEAAANTDLAIENYNKALVLNPEISGVSERLERLRNN